LAPPVAPKAAGLWRAIAIIKNNRRVGKKRPDQLAFSTVGAIYREFCV
jgi:hypothetical protein